MSEEILYFTHVLFRFNHQKHTKRLNEHRHISVLKNIPQMLLPVFQPQVLQINGCTEIGGMPVKFCPLYGKVVFCVTCLIENN